MDSPKKTSSKMVEDYMRYLKLERSLTPNTLDAYRHDLGKLERYAEAAGVRLEDVSLPDLQTFSAALHDIGIGPVSQGRILSGVRSFYRFLVIDGYRDDDPTELLEWPQTGEHLPSVLTEEEVDRLEDSIDLSQPLGHRNRAIIEVLYSCGLRVSELVNLKLSCLFLDEQFVKVFGKGRKERLVPISARAIRELRDWFEWRDRMDLSCRPRATAQSMVA